MGNTECSCGLPPGPTGATEYLSWQPCQFEIYSVLQCQEEDKRKGKKTKVRKKKTDVRKIMRTYDKLENALDPAIRLLDLSIAIRMLRTRDL